MADLSIVKIKIRRGSNSDRLRVVLDEGELGYATDYQRLFVGDGNTLGGISIANKFLGSGVRNTFGSALVGDTVYDVQEKNIFSLSALPPSLSGNWVNVGPKTDNTYLYYNTAFKLDIVPDSVDRTKIKVTDIVFEALSATLDRRLTVLYDNNTVQLNGSNQLYVNSFALPLTGLKYATSGNGLDCSNLTLDNLTVVFGVSGAFPGASTEYDSVLTNGVYILNEPVGTTLYYLMIKL
jgi:hypothetical protein